ncbi:MAG: type II secretion system F family protein [Candidatus Aenigmatarchaeota archaeon]
MLFEMYVGRMIFITVFSFIITFLFVFIMFSIFTVPILISIISALIAALSISFILLTLYHSYPFHLITSKKTSIEANMPFAINHIAAIAASGVPPFVMFKLISNIKEYGEITNEAKRIIRNVDTFGMDIISAIRNVADRTPSPKFKQFLYGIISTVETGGDLKRYLENSAKEALFEYRLVREKYMQTLSTYADFYTAVLIAAPLFFISTLSVMSMVGGSIFGLSIPNAIRIGIYVLMPILNIVFIMFIHYTQPRL